MSDPFVDTNVFIRLITEDDPAKKEAAVALFSRVEAGTLTLRAPVTVIADAVFVLSSRALYNLSRQQIRDGLVPLLSLPNFRVTNRRILLRALDLYAATNLDFGDAMLLAAMERAGSHEIYSWDEDFDGKPGITRPEL